MPEENKNAPPRDPLEDAYTGEALQALVDDLEEHEETLEQAGVPEEDFSGIKRPVRELKENIKEFAEQEKIYGPEPEAKKHYLPYHSAVTNSMDTVAKAFQDGAPEAVKKTYLNTAGVLAGSANHYWRTEFARLKEKEKCMEQEMNSIRSQMEDLQKTAQTNHFTPEAMAQSMMLAMTFLENAKMLRDMAHKEKHPATARLFQDARGAVHEVYQGIVGIPKRVERNIQNKAFQIADKFIGRITGVFDRGIQYLSKRKQAIAQMSPLYAAKVAEADVQAAASQIAPKVVEDQQKMEPEQSEQEQHEQAPVTDVPTPDAKWQKVLQSHRRIEPGAIPDYLLTEEGKALPKEKKAAVLEKIKDTIIAETDPNLSDNERKCVTRFLDLLTPPGSFRTGEGPDFSERSETNIAIRMAALIMSGRYGESTAEDAVQFLHKYVPIVEAKGDDFVPHIIQKAQKEPEVVMKDIDYHKFDDNFYKLDRLISNFRENADGFRDKLPDAEHKFLSSFLPKEQNFYPAAIFAEDYAKLETLEKQESLLETVAKEALLDNALQSDVVDLINKYAPMNGIYKTETSQSLGEKIVAKVLKDPEVQRVVDPQTQEQQK